jgi:hypothetical protein
MKYYVTLFLFSVFTLNGLYAQVGLGTINGTIYDNADSKTVVPNAKVWVETESGNRIVKADLDGRFKIDALRPGIYNLYAKAAMFDTLEIVGLEVFRDGITNRTVYLSDKSLTVVVITEPLIKKDIPRIQFRTEDIENSPFIRDPLGLIAGSTSDIKQVEGSKEIIIRGSRPGDAVYYIDGVKTTSMASLPGVAIGGLEAYTGGIPAKYGDTTGGIIVLETKSYFDLYYAWKAGVK